MKFIDLSKEDRTDVLDRVSTELNIRQREVIEKDWWVTAVLRAIFCLPYAQHLSFKGGTSLSKCWHLINRFSEDIDIAIDREYLGFSGTLSKTQISDKLRRATCSFVRDTMQHDIAEQLHKNGIAKDADFIFDSRFLPNPFWDPSLRNKTGLDVEVANFFEKYPQVNLYINQIDEMLTGWLGAIEKSNRSYLTVAIGCTGGCHRSVFIAQSLYERFEQRGLLTKVRHRSLEALKNSVKKS